MKTEKSVKVKFDKTVPPGLDRTTEEQITVPRHLYEVLHKLAWDLVNYDDATVTLYLNVYGSTSYRITGDDIRGEHIL